LLTIRLWNHADSINDKARQVFPGN